MSWSVTHSTNAIVTYYMVSKHIEFIFAKYLHTPVVSLDQINRLWLDHQVKLRNENPSMKVVKQIQFQKKKKSKKRSKANDKTYITTYCLNNVASSPLLYFFNFFCMQHKINN